jgi:TetR/AcrR family transcriptional repressor of nem operon
MGKASPADGTDPPNPPSAGSAPRRRPDARGLATRNRIIAAAADLIYFRGANAVTLDDVRAATGTSKSQFYKHFAGKPELIRAVVEYRAQQVMAREDQRLRNLKSIRGLRRWRDALVQTNALQSGAYGCALGSMAVELSDQDGQVRSSLSQTFASWKGLLAAGFRRMQDGGSLSPDADPDALATGLMAALQGGYLLAQADRDVAAMATSLDLALAQIKSLTIEPGHPVAAPSGTVRPLTPARLRTAVEAGAVVLDARTADDFASAQLRGSFNVGFTSSMAITAAAVCDPADRVVVIAYPGDEALAVQRLSELGFADVVGIFTLEPGSTFPVRLTDLVESTRRTSPRELHQLLAEGAVTVVDVRGAQNRSRGTIPKAIQIPLDELHDRLDSIPTGRPVVVQYAAGGRSSAAASLLRANGVADVSDLTGGFSEWPPQAD